MRKFFMIVILCVSCSADKTPYDYDADADGGVGSDSDTGLDADAGADSDSDSDSDGDSDGDADGDGDSDSDTDSDNDSDTDVDAGTDADSGADSGPDGDGDSDSDSDTGDAGPDAGLCMDGTTVAGSAGTTWVSICGGTFWMGSTSSSSEMPVHSVTVPDFEMLRTEVTVTQYAACVSDSACTEPETSGMCPGSGNWGVSGRENHPMNCATWAQAASFCAWAGGRLPTESEWEYAARSGGQLIAYPWGNDVPTCTYAVMNDGSGSGCDTGHSWPVCSKPMGNTDQGLCDMAGNASEWIQDWDHTDYTGAPSDGGAWVVPSGFERVVRGGDYWSNGTSIRVSHRSSWIPSEPDYLIGFRCARDL